MHLARFVTLCCATLSPACVSSSSGSREDAAEAGVDATEDTVLDAIADATPDATADTAVITSDSSLFPDDANQAEDAAAPNDDCDPSCAAAGGTCSGNRCTLVDNVGGVSETTQALLEGGGTTDPQFRWLYPYDRVMWARGLLPPTLQFDGEAATALYVRIRCSTLDYKGFFSVSNPVRVTLTPPMWSAVMNAVLSASEPVVVEATKVSGAAVTGPQSQTWFVAPGRLRGTLYFESYDSPILGGKGSLGIMKIKPGEAQPQTVTSGCGNVCHAVSANGSTLVANHDSFGFSSSSYDLRNNTSVLMTVTSQAFTYGGIYPDGSFVMSATHFRTWMGGASKLYDTKTGMNIPAPGWDGALTNGGTTAFAPDGSKLAFVHEDKDSGATLAVMDFDNATKTFSNLVDVATHPGKYVAWPSFTPDTRTLIYQVGSHANFETDNNETGDVYAVDLATKTPRRLDRLDGYLGTTTYLPAADPGLSFIPSVLPEAVGGFFWLVFTSHRSVGNTLPSKDNGDQNGKLWVAAIDIAAPAGADISHPPFYLDGQEAAADNLHAAWALDPCKANGQGCGRGDECCDGYCRDSGGGAAECVPAVAGCSRELEKCNETTDCCDSTEQCINHRCASLAP